MQASEVDCVDCLDCYCGDELRRAIRNGDNLIKIKYLRRTERPDRTPVLKQPIAKKKKASPDCACPSQPKPTRHSHVKKSVGKGTKPSLRVLELACPTKRHCLQTLKDKGHILPIDMLDKLTEQVLLKRPTLGVDDAVDMWTKQKHRLKREKQKLAKKIKKDETVRKYAILLARKLIPNIEYSYDISLSPELERLSAVVARDIKSIWKKRNRASKEMITDISKKMAIWMSTIVEKAEDLLLEDDLRDLEDQFGPVFDVIDEIFDRVMELCVKLSPYISMKSSDEKFASNLSTEKSSKVKFTSSQEDYKMIAATSKEVVQDVIDKASLSILNQMNALSDDESDNNDFYNVNNSLHQEERPDNQSLENYFTDILVELITNDINHEADVSTVDANVAKSVAKEDFLSKTIHHNDSNYILSSDETSRKVTFSVGELDEPWRETIKNLVLSEAKPSLLSDADDEWPPNHVPVVRSLMLMSKSASSLGIIEENEKPNQITDSTNLDNNQTEEKKQLFIHKTNSIKDGKNTNPTQLDRTNMIIDEGGELTKDKYYEATQLTNFSEIQTNKHGIEIKEEDKHINPKEENIALKEQEITTNLKREKEHIHDEIEQNNKNVQEQTNFKNPLSNQDKNKQDRFYSKPQILNGNTINQPIDYALAEEIRSLKIAQENFKDKKYQVNKSQTELLGQVAKNQLTKDNEKNQEKNKQDHNMHSTSQSINGNSINQLIYPVLPEKVKSMEIAQEKLKVNKYQVNENQTKPLGHVEEQHLASGITKGKPYDAVKDKSRTKVYPQDKISSGHKILGNRVDYTKSQKITPNIRFNYKVEPGSAPLWVKRDELELRKLHTNEYCEDLCAVAERLEKWAQWIDLTCINMLVINRCEGTLGSSLRYTRCVCRRPSPWRELRSHVDRDAVRWQQYAQHASHKLTGNMQKKRGNILEAESLPSSTHAERCGRHSRALI